MMPSALPAPVTAAHPYPLDPTTKYGRCIATLYSELSGLSSDTSPVSSEEWRIKAFPVMRSFMEAHRIAEIDFTVHDQMLMMTDPVANEIRRVFNHEWAAQQLEAAASGALLELSETEQKFLGDVANILRCSGYSRFLGLGHASRESILQIHPTSAGLLIDDTVINAVVASADCLSASAMGLIRKFDAELLATATRLESEADPEWGRYYSARKADTIRRGNLFTDPAHLWKNLVLDFRMLYIWKHDETFLGQFHALPTPTSFMILEDNPLHQWVFSPLANIEGASFYAPGTPSHNSDVPGNVSNRCFSTATAAQREIELALQCDFNLPSVVVADIELLDTDRTGLDFVEWLDSASREAGRRHELSIVMVYSSNMSMYEERIAQLRARQVINGATPKEHFRLINLLEQVA